MLTPLLTYQELSDYLCGVTSSLVEDDLPRLISTLQYYQDRLGDLTPIIKSLEGEPRRRAFRMPASWVTPPKTKKRKLALDELRRREGDSYAAIAALHTLLSPIRRLPSELLTEIFLYCLPRTRFIYPGDPHSPLRLMRVCSQWHKICTTSPQLWSSIELAYPSKDLSISSITEQSTRKAALLDMWLSRSGDLSLSLSIQGQLLAVGAIQRLLETCAGRLQHIELLFSDNDSCMLPDCGYPRLTRLDVQSPKGLRHKSVIELSNIAKRTSTLQRFTWSNTASYMFLPPPVILHWLGITHLTLKATITIEHCLLILSQATNAIQLEFGSVFVVPAAPQIQIPHVILPRLSSFSIASLRDISQVFDALTLPHLTSLSISSLLWSHTSVVSLFQRSRFPLQNLVFFHAPITESALVEFLELVHSTLKELTVQGGDPSTVTDALLDRFTPKPGDEMLCPHLEGIALYDCITCTPGGLARMARSRLLGGACFTDDSEHRMGEDPMWVSPLRVMELYSTEPELASLKPLRSMGLKLIAYCEDDLTVVDIDHQDV